MRSYFRAVQATLLLLTTIEVLAATSIALLSPALNAAAATGAEGEGMKSLGAATLILPVPVWIIGSYDSLGTPPRHGMRSASARVRPDPLAPVPSSGGAPARQCRGDSHDTRTANEPAVP